VSLLTQPHAVSGSPCTVMKMASQINVRAILLLAIIAMSNPLLVVSQRNTRYKSRN
jgi:hypothetical protein